MSYKMLRPFIVKVFVLGYFPLVGMLILWVVNNIFISE